MTDPEYERAFQDDIAICVQVLLRHADDPRFAELSGPQALKAMAITFATASVTMVPASRPAPAQGEA